MTTRSLPPPCPICGGATRLKTTHKLAENDKLMYIFFCRTCALEYPVAIKAAETEQAGSVPGDALRKST
jgi:hypothetical protein